MFDKQYRDDYGVYSIQAEEEFDGKLYQWRKYVNLSRTRALGGLYANWCEDGTIKFYRTEYLRDRAFPQFVEDTKETKSIMTDFEKKFIAILNTHDEMCPNRMVENFWGKYMLIDAGDGYYPIIVHRCTMPGLGTPEVYKLLNKNMKKHLRNPNSKMPHFERQLIRFFNEYDEREIEGNIEMDAFWTKYVVIGPPDDYEYFAIIYREDHNQMPHKEAIKRINKDAGVWRKIIFDEDINWGPYDSWYESVEDANAACFEVDKDGNLIIPKGECAWLITERGPAGGHACINYHGTEIDVVDLWNFAHEEDDV